VVVPTEVPREAPPEADPATSEPSGGPGAENGVIGGTGTGAVADPSPPALPPKPAGPVELPQGAMPPRASADNAVPEYPERARAGGQEGQVILRVVITETGKVTRIQVLHGDEPFLAAALAAVKAWTYSPATVDGHPIDTPEKLSDLIAKHSPGETVKLLVFAGDQFREVAVALKAAP